ncbi:MAG: hypothetical protein GF317_19925 [Candidatus Lokiarchaeota archaeon]|nr:hypothetical protein [Candidatus Lokiarchaeota archaeon]MBD3201762.1 hypothetical protein [Candidatus Lokiarchaeota archaeon]
MNESNYKLNVKKVVIFKHGVSYFILQGKKKGSGTFELEFKIDEMNDVLKSLFVLDTSEKGYISSISYDAALDTAQLLKSIMLDIPDRDSLSSLITQIKGAKVNLTIGTDIENISGKIMGLEFIEKMKEETKIHEKLLVLLKEDGGIVKISFSEISSLDILNEDLKKDLKFFLDIIIAGKKKDSKKVIINSESGGDDQVERDIFVSYIRESPIWKTSYRLLMSKEQEEAQRCLLSGWCMIENTTNQDWDKIELSMVAGMPVSFVYDFYRPIFITRPKIKPPKVLSAKPTEIEEGLATESYKKYAESKPMGAPSAPPGGSAPQKMRESMRVRGGLEKALSMTADMDDATLKEKLSTSTQTKTKDLGELFEYNISNPVSIKRKHSALVPILTEEIDAKKILLYNMNELEKHPNACLEIKNSTALTLERGPATIIYDNNLAGEAMIPFMNKGDKRILNYAVEQAVLIHHEQKSESRDVHRIGFSGAYCYEYYNTIKTTKYKIKNKAESNKILYLDHPKTSGYKIIEKPKEPEETPNYWRFTLTLNPKDAVEFNIKEETENYTTYYIWNWNKEDILQKVSFYIRKKFIDTELEAKLKKIAELIEKLNKLNASKSKLEEERNEMNTEQQRLRENIKVLGNTSQEASLREKYVKKLTQQENRFEEIKSKIEEYDQEIQKLNTRIEEKINAL